MTNSKPIVLVTGGAGYVGSQTVWALLAANFFPVVIDNLSTGFAESLPPVPFYNGDIRDIQLLEKVFTEFKISAVIHLAAKIVIEESILDPMSYYDNNVNGLLNIGHVCKKHNVKKIIFSSSGTIYGNANFISDSSKISENSLISPMSPYGYSKLFGEQILRDLKNSDGIQSICLRYFNVAGAAADGRNGQRRLAASHIVHVAARAALSSTKEITIFGSDYPTLDGTCIRDYIHVEDISDIHVEALKYLLIHNESHILNCGYGHGYSVKQVVNAFETTTNVPLKIKYGKRRLGDPVSLICDSTKLYRLLQWRPRFADIGTICKTAYQWEAKLNRSANAEV